MPGAPAGLLSTGDSARSFSARSSLVPHPPAAVAVPPTGGPPSASRFCRLYQSTYPSAPPAIASAASGIPTPRPILRDLLVPPPAAEEPSLPSLPFWMAVGVGDDGTGLVKRLDAVSGDDSVTNDGVVVGVVVRPDPVPLAPPPDVVLAAVVAVVRAV